MLGAHLIQIQLFFDQDVGQAYENQSINQSMKIFKVVKKGTLYIEILIKTNYSKQINT